MKSFFKKFTKTPLSQAEWKEIRWYQRIPFHKKLEALDNYRSFLFEVWKRNPKIYRNYLKLNPK